MGAEYHDNKYLISRNKGDKTDIYSCPCTGGQTCSLWKSVEGIFTFHMTSYKGDLYLIGTGPKNYRTNNGGKVNVIRADGKVETLLNGGPGSGTRAKVFDDKLFWGFAYDAEIWSYDGSSKKQEKTFAGMDHFGSFELFDGKLFAAVVNEGGGTEIWFRNSTSDGGGWVQAFSQNQLGGYGVSGNLVNSAGFFTKYNDSLYFSINTPRGGRGGPGYILEIKKSNLSSDSSGEIIQWNNDKFVFEAEDYSEKDSSWVLDKSSGGYYGEGYIRGTAPLRSSSPIKYKLNFTSSGKYYIHLRTLAKNSVDNGLYLSLDGNDISNTGSLFKEGGKTVIYLPKTNSWNWNNQVTRPNDQHDDTPYFEINSIGIKEFIIHQREQNARIDQIVISKSAVFNS